MAASCRQITEAVRAAIRKANRALERATQGEHWLSDFGVESLMVGYVWQALCRLNRTGLTLVEMPMSTFDDAMVGRGRKPGPKPRGLRGGGRCDLGLLDAHGRPFALVELKRSSAPQGLSADLERMAAALDRYGVHRGGTLKTAVLGIWIAGATESAFDKKRAAVEAVAETFARRAELRVQLAPGTEKPRVWKYGDWRCLAATISLQRAK